MRGALAALLVVSTAACSRPVVSARLDAEEPTHPREEKAALRWANTRCPTALGYLVPGLGQICLDKNAEGATLISLSVTHATTGAAVALTQDDGIGHPGAFIPLVALQDLWIYGIADVAIERSLAEQDLYAPRDSLADLVLAPFNIQVLKRPDVWLGTLLVLGAGIGVSLLTDESGNSDNLGADPNVFGHTIDRAWGYPLGYGIGAGLFSHVAIAEEALFRGQIQSGLARRTGETAGWIYASLLFGVTHAANALFIPEEERVEYLAIGVPFITALGSYLGVVYRRADYSLAPPVAVHFWYDFLLSAVFFTLDPQNSPLSAGISIPF